MNFVSKVKNALDLVAWTMKEYPDVILGCSFGKDSMVTLHLAKTLYPNIPVFGVMANTEFEETYEFEKRMVQEWGLNYTGYVYEQEEGFLENLALCCGKPKVETTKKAVKDVSAWISGVRKTEGITRSDFEEVETKGNLVKINPILEFTELDIWRYTALYNIPVNPKYTEGYRSLGCKYCSTPEEFETESERAGRWKGTDKAQGECGIHTAILK